MSTGSAPVIMLASNEKVTLSYDSGLLQIIAFGSSSDYLKAVKRSNIDAVEDVEDEEGY